MIIKFATALSWLVVGIFSLSAFLNIIDYPKSADTQKERGERVIFCVLIMLVPAAWLLARYL